MIPHHILAQYLGTIPPYTLRDARDYLNDLAEGKKHSDYGICSALRYNPNTSLHLWNFFISACAPYWPHYSGKPAYPIPHPTKATPRDGYQLAGLNGELWSGSYGELRKKFAAHIANQIDRYLEYRHES